MSLIGQSVKTYLLSKSAVTNVAGTRVFSDYLPGSITTFPSVVMLQVSQVNPQHLTAQCDYAETRLQLDVYSDQASTRDSFANTLRDEMNGFSGTMGSVAVSEVKLVNSRDGYEPPQDNSDSGLYRNSSDYWIRHAQAVPSFA